MSGETRVRLPSGRWLAVLWSDAGGLRCRHVFADDAPVVARLDVAFKGGSMPLDLCWACSLGAGRPAQDGV